MSVSTRSTKAVMYSEIERMRDLLDLQDQRLRAQDETIAQQAQQLRAQSEEIERLRASAQPQSPRISERSARLKAFARKFRCTARWSGDTIELYSKKRQCWVAVPEGTQP